jgi:2-dehydropantoate 2-reductase
MNVLIFGAGAVGLGVASSLARAGEAVHLIGRPATVDALEAQGLLRSGLFGDDHVPPARLGLHVEPSTLPQTPVDYVVVATKSFDTEQAARSLAPLPQVQDARHVLFQNGWGNVEAYSAHHPADRVFAARVITGFERPAPNHVRVTVHADDIRVGSFQPGRETEVMPLAHAIASGGIPCSTTPHVARDLWAKMLYNCALNSLGAVFEVTYGELAARAESRRIMDGLIAEAFAVMSASGHETHWATPQEYLRTFYETLVPRTARHVSSTLQDIRARKRTEIQALNGQVVSLGKRAEVPVPLNALVLDMVLFKEERGREIASD